MVELQYYIELENMVHRVAKVEKNGITHQVFNSSS